MKSDRRVMSLPRQSPGHVTGHRKGCLNPQQVGKETDRRLAAIIESSDDAIISKDLNGVIRTWNKAAERIFGYTAREVIGKPVTILIPEARLYEESAILKRLRQGRRIDHYQTVRRRKDGTLLDISLTISPIRDAHGRVIGASKIARDITAWKKTQEERAAKEALARLNEDLERRVGERTASLNGAIAQLEEFSYTVSHDLRAPARVMRAYAEIVLTEHGDELKPQVKDYLERIARGGARMDRLVQDTLTYSRLARRELTFHSIEPERLILDIISQYPEMALPRAAITIHRPLQPVEAHEPSLTQAISNLLSNAVKFVPVGEIPHVLIRTEKRATGVRLWVEDNGIGIPPAYLNRAFGVFERLHPDSCYEGTGIGLAIVRKVVERMDGTVGVESDGLTGSRFWIELPPAKNHGPTISNPSSR